MKKDIEWSDILNKKELEQLEDELSDVLEVFVLTDGMTLFFSNHEAKRDNDVLFTLEKGDIVIDGLYSKDTGKLFDFDIGSINDLELQKFIKNEFPKVLVEKINEIINDDEI